MFDKLRGQLKIFLADNPDIIQVTMRRPTEPLRELYGDATTESWGRMPESCPLVEAVLLKHLPGDSPAQERLRSDILDDIKDQITHRFRRELEGSLRQKYSLLEKMKQMQRMLRDSIEENETEKPSKSNEPPVPVETRSQRARRLRRRGEFEVEVNPNDEDEG